MQIFYPFLIALLAATSCAIVVAQDGVELANESQSIAISGLAEQVITNPLSSQVWELLNAYDSHGEAQTG